MLSFAELTSPQVAGLLTATRRPVLLLPVGAIEPHGPHAPLSTDQMISIDVCERVAKRLADHPSVRALVLPPLPYGVTRYASAFPGAVHVSEETLHALVTDVCGSLTSQGFTEIVVVNNHFEPEHVTTLRRATKDAGVRYLDLVRRQNAARLTAEFQSGSCHAGQYETSLVLASRPDLVDQEQMAALDPLRVDMPSAMANGQADFVAMGMDQAYCGSPAAATAEEGERTYAVLVDMVLELIGEV
ncbi:creatininase family protein [Kibdelosporangium phytohabitans]|uniref:Creatinine amidohydrolase n=1 Tax=Kibdelosporangium phytohabitans TaxID=860235 RepID=A0A0N9I4S0_9PSEU|nr:creatininase family protein [Kibdelosporangium phytohabitans]ALG11092.1 creatinine amidohydrolase [Kibdelosporangium phytohabitans]MBE1462335.1 creatinine amidohydrolase [Kibdelosporangium phytohabitans]